MTCLYFSLAKRRYVLIQCVSVFGICGLMKCIHQHQQSQKSNVSDVLLQISYVFSDMSSGLGPVSQKARNFSGPKVNFKIQTCWIAAQFPAHKPVNFGSLTESFILLFSKLLKRWSWSKRGNYKGENPKSSRDFRETGPWKGIPGIWDLTKIRCGIREELAGHGIWLYLGSEIRQNLGTDVGVGKKDIRVSNEFWDGWFSWKRCGNAGSGIPFPDPMSCH